MGLLGKILFYPLLICVVSTILTVLSWLEDEALGGTIFFLVVAIVSGTFFIFVLITLAKDLSSNRSEKKENVELQDNLEKSFFVKIIDDLKGIEQHKHLFGNELIFALAYLYKKYCVPFPDVEEEFVVRTEREKMDIIHSMGKGGKPKIALDKYSKQVNVYKRVWNKNEPAELWRHLWLIYNPELTEEPPIFKHPELLFCTPRKKRLILPIVKYYDKDGVEVHPKGANKYRFYKYTYTPSSNRLQIDVTTPVPVYLINYLVVELTKKELASKKYLYSTTRMESQSPEAKPSSATKPIVKEEIERKVNPVDIHKEISNYSKYDFSYLDDDYVWPESEEIIESDSSVNSLKTRDEPLDKTNVEMQRSLECKHYYDVINSLVERDKVEPLYDEDILKAIFSLYRNKYKIKNSDNIDFGWVVNDYLNRDIPELGETRISSLEARLCIMWEHYLKNRYNPKVTDSLFKRIYGCEEDAAAKIYSNPTLLFDNKGNRTKLYSRWPDNGVAAVLIDDLVVQVTTRELRKQGYDFSRDYVQTGNTTSGGCYRI